MTEEPVEKGRRLPKPKLVKSRVTKTVAAAPAAATQADGALRLLQIEAEARRRTNPNELLHHLANETRGVIEFRQAFVFRNQNGRLKLHAVSSLSTFDKNAPLIQAIQTLLRQAERNDALGSVVAMEMPEAEKDSFAFRQLLWAPLKTRKGKVAGGVFFARERPWPERQKTLAERLSEVYSHAYSALTNDRIRGMPVTVRNGLRIGVLVGLIALAFLPVPLTAIAPVEIVGKDATIVTAPLDGVVREIMVSPNEPVTAGDVLVRFEDTELRNAADIAAQAVLVASARLAATSSSAFGSADARRELAISEAELDLALAEKALADERLTRAQIVAQTSGLIILDDSEDWAGRPVSIGERILEIADPEQVEYRVALAVDDLIVMQGDERMRVFLDSDPLKVRPAIVSRASFHALEQPDGSLAYEVFAQDDGEPDALLRIGARGSAQILGEEASLGFVIFRRPISWLRQTFGV